MRQIQDRAGSLYKFICLSRQVIDFCKRNYQSIHYRLNVKLKIGMQADGTLRPNCLRGFNFFEHEEKKRQLVFRGRVHVISKRRIYCHITGSIQLSDRL